MLKSHFISIIFKFIKTIRPDFLIAYINARIELREININPIWIFGFILKKRCVANYICINRILKSVWKIFFQELLVLMFWKIYFIITGWFWSVRTVAGT